MSKECMHFFGPLCIQFGSSGYKSGYWRGEFSYTKGRSVSPANCSEYKTEHNRRKCSQWETAYFPARFTKEKNLFTLLHVPVGAELLKTLQKKEVCLRHSGIKKKILALLLKPLVIPGHAVAQLVEALRYKPEGRGFDSRWCHWNFSLT